ncbi:MAG: phosphoenolpyruvate hydrolase family protein [Candidatus Limnocylindrales bacterium]
MTGDEARQRLRAAVTSGQLIVGAGAGTGLSAVCAEEGGADLIVIYNSGRFRMAGRGSLAGLMPFGDANAIVVDMAREVLPVVRRTPVIAGVCGTDPFRSMPRFLAELRDLGFAGIQNFPTVALYDGMFRQGLEETGMGFELEVAMVRAARDLGLLTVVYCVTEDEARSMAGVPADIVVAHVGLTTKGRIGARSGMTLDEAAERVQAIRDAVAEVDATIPVLCHGGPIAEVGDVRYVLDRTTGVAGFLGASSMERLPTEVAITATVRGFKELRPRPGADRHGGGERTGR